ncbi:hypothetical protein [Bacillus phage YungSlug]|nr:hypothetical protein [Bacillus phage YungSlug]
MSRHTRRAQLNGFRANKNLPIKKFRKIQGDMKVLDKTFAWHGKKKDDDTTFIERLGQFVTYAGDETTYGPLISVKGGNGC